MARVTGIGGVFFRSAAASDLQEWYEKHLGLTPDADGYIVLRWGSENGSTVWAPFDGEADYFGGQGSQFMVNYRVDDLDGLVESLRRDGVRVADERFEDSNGKFAHCWDLEGNKVELWEPAPGS